MEQRSSFTNCLAGKNDFTPVFAYSWSHFTVTVTNGIDVYVEDHIGHIAVLNLVFTAPLRVQRRQLFIGIVLVFVLLNCLPCQTEVQATHYEFTLQGD